MTTKYRIVLGFVFMVLLSAGLSIFAWMRLEQASTGFDKYSLESRTGVYANKADALLREAKDKVDKFIDSLDESVIAQAHKDLENSIKNVEESKKYEQNPDNIRQLDGLIAQIKKIENISIELQQKLLKADKAVNENLAAIGSETNDMLTNINNAAARVNNIPALDAIDDAYSRYADFLVAVSTYKGTYKPEDAAKAYKLINEYGEAMKKLDKTILREEVRKHYNILIQGYNSYYNLFKEVDTLIKEGMTSRKQFGDLSTEISNFFDFYTDQTLKNMNVMVAATHAGNDNAQTTMITASVAGMVVGILFAIWIILSVVKMLGKVAGFAEDVAAGNFNARLEVREAGEIGVMVKSVSAIPATLKEMSAEYTRLEKRIEEGSLDILGDSKKFSGDFSALVQGTNNILQRITLILNSIPSPIIVLDKDLKAAFMNTIAQSLAGSDYKGKTCQDLFNIEDSGPAGNGLALAVSSGMPYDYETVASPKGRRMNISYSTIPLKDAHGKLASVLQLIIDLTKIKDTEHKIVKAATIAMENADRVAAASEELSAQVEQVSRGSEVQRSRVESTATAMNQMNATVLEVARSAGNAAEQSEETRKKADDGTNLMNKMVKSINGVNTVALVLQNNMQELGRQAESIGSVMNVISDIADQTNLLALNAAIEAARAGDAGRGFAVVADEVRKLAEKTMHATQEVGNSIKSIQLSAKANIDEVSNAVKNIHEATDLAETSGHALAEIAVLAASSSSVVASIAATAEEQSATSEEINSSLEEVSRIVNETADGMTQASAAVQDLSQTAQQLKSIMEQLRT